MDWRSSSASASANSRGTTPPASTVVPSASVADPPIQPHNSQVSNGRKPSCSPTLRDVTPTPSDFLLDNPLLPDSGPTLLFGSRVTSVDLADLRSSGSPSSNPPSPPLMKTSAPTSAPIPTPISVPGSTALPTTDIVHTHAAVRIASTHDDVPRASMSATDSALGSASGSPHNAELNLLDAACAQHLLNSAVKEEHFLQPPSVPSAVNSPSKNNTILITECTPGVLDMSSEQNAPDTTHALPGYVTPNLAIRDAGKENVGTMDDVSRRLPLELDLSSLVDNFIDDAQILPVIDDLTSLPATSLASTAPVVPPSITSVIDRGPRRTKPTSAAAGVATATAGQAGPSSVTNGKGGTRRTDKRKPRTYSQAVPSQHCHICSRRPGANAPHAVCGNLVRGRCRKTICTKCFATFRWDLNAATKGPPGSWECPHCRGECPQRAQCVIYNRTSDRRRLKLINHRKRKCDDGGSSSKCKEPESKKRNVSGAKGDGKKCSAEKTRVEKSKMEKVIVSMHQGDTEHASGVQHEDPLGTPKTERAMSRDWRRGEDPLAPVGLWGEEIAGVRVDLGELVAAEAREEEDGVDMGWFLGEGGETGGETGGERREQQLGSVGWPGAATPLYDLGLAPVGLGLGTENESGARR